MIFWMEIDRLRCGNDGLSLSDIVDNHLDSPSFIPDVVNVTQDGAYHGECHSKVSNIKECLRSRMDIDFFPSLVQNNGQLEVI